MPCRAAQLERASSTRSIASVEATPSYTSVVEVLRAHFDEIKKVMGHFASLDDNRMEMMAKAKDRRSKHAARVGTRPHGQMAHGQMAHGQMAHGGWPMADGPWRMVHG